MYVWPQYTYKVYHWQYQNDLMSSLPEKNTFEMGARPCELNSVEILILTLTAIQEPALYLFLFLSPILMKYYSWIELQSIDIHKSLADILYFFWLIPLTLPSGSCAWRDK